MPAELRCEDGRFVTTATASVAMADRLEFWQGLFSSCTVSRPRTSQRSDFRSTLTRCVQADGSAVVGIKGDPLVCRFGRQESGMILVGHVRAGTLNVRHDDDRRTSIDNGSGLVLLDCDRPLVTSSTGYELAELVMPRVLLANALGGHHVLRDKAVFALPKDGLSPILSAHLDAMAACGATLDRADAAAAMQTATSLVIALLSRYAQRQKEGGALDEQLFAAAMRYIEVQSWRHELTAGAIATAVGCSRAHLYRLFAGRSLQVAAVLRDIRLARARHLIETNDCRPIGMIAFDCGYSDLSAFGKAFRRRYGLSPGECRFEATHNS